MMTVPVSPIHWVRSFRIISAAQTEKRIFNSIASQQEADILYALDSATRAPKVGKSDFVNNCFRYRSKSRFSNGEYSVYYAARTIDTAIKETRYHRALFLSKTKEDPMDLPMRAYVANIRGTFHDIRGMKARLRSIYSSKEGDYSASQAFAKSLVLEESKGIVFSSVRDPEGQCAGVFNPRCITNAHEERRLVYHWNGRLIQSVSEVKEFLSFRS